MKRLMIAAALMAVSVQAQAQTGINMSKDALAEVIATYTLFASNCHGELTPLVKKRLRDAVKLVDIDEVEAKYNKLNRERINAGNFIFCTYLRPHMELVE